VLAGFSAFKRFARKQSLIPSNAHPSSMASARPLGELLFDASDASWCILGAENCFQIFHRRTEVSNLELQEIHAQYLRLSENIRRLLLRMHGIQLL
jgi:hypothetical protein